MANDPKTVQEETWRRELLRGVYAHEVKAWYVVISPKGVATADPQPAIDAANTAAKNLETAKAALREIEAGIAFMWDVEEDKELHAYNIARDTLRSLETPE